MNGIGIIIPNADFSDSPLGQVTIVVSNAERADNIATAYCTAVGSSTHKTALKNFVKQLLDDGIWDDIKMFFPMIGDTLAHQMVDLKDTTRSAHQFESYSYNEHGITVDNTILCDKPSSTLWSVEIPYIGTTGFFAGYTLNSGSVNSHPVFLRSITDDVDGQNSFVRDTNTVSYGITSALAGSPSIIQLYSSTDIPYSGKTVLNTPRRAIFYNSNDAIHLITDGEDAYHNVSGQGRTANTMYPVIGVSKVSSGHGGNTVVVTDRDAQNKMYGQRAWEGPIYAYGVGQFDSLEDVMKFDAAFATFLSNTGKIVV